MCLEIYKCGRRVVTKINCIKAIITGVTIRFAAVQYELSYFSEMEYKSIWMNENEFDPENGEVQKIGFIK